MNLYLNLFNLGAMILRKEYKDAVNAILEEKPFHDINLNEALKEWSISKDAEKAFTMLPKKHQFSIEGSLLYNLKKSKNIELSTFTYNWFNAIISMQRNNRSLYIHAYQSYLWNMLATYRIKVVYLK